ncbi:hypothetical protein KSZ_68490 [Dictyobacter formicarum]|uniref:Uncharacterized protein n=1 Tax=Dictyobacter formicarum TaxID=2778368 RepID=A0ABQ3VSQ0_9CHLR|nr:hypothetical protein KSZ_68490 [Dictyobacter formicarum]
MKFNKNIRHRNVSLKKVRFTKMLARFGEAVIINPITEEHIITIINPYIINSTVIGIWLCVVICGSSGVKAVLLK